MARIKLKMPDTYTFTTIVPVRITDLNYGGHLGHNSFMAILHEARMRMLADKGFSETDIGGCGLIMADTAIVFLSEVFYPSTLRIDVNISEPTRTEFSVYYWATHSESGVPVANAKTGMICFDYAKKRVVRVPAKFSEAFALSAP